MPEITLKIGGRAFDLACDAGEETSLEQAAGMLDFEAQTLQQAIGRVPESRMLLMAGLMLADRTKQAAIDSEVMAERVKGLEELLRKSEEKNVNLILEHNTAKKAISSADLFDDSADLLNGVAEKLEKLADQLENR